MELAVLGEVMNIKIKKLKKILIDLKLMIIFILFII
jgi:hypothetical protein